DGAAHFFDRFLQREAEHGEADVVPVDEQARAASLQLVAIGVALVVILIVRPRGILGETRTVSRHVPGASRARV
ncbi:MAG: hypothetical protein WCH83_18345, partial [Alphaproteobacteria bacterium]